MLSCSMSEMYYRCHINACIYIISQCNQRPKTPFTHPLDHDTCIRIRLIIAIYIKNLDR